MSNRGFFKLGSCSGKWMRLNTLMLCLNGIAYIVEILFIAEFIRILSDLGTVGLSGGIFRASVIRLLLVLSAVMLVKVVSVRLGSLFSCRISIGVKLSIRKKIFAKIIALGPGCADESSTAEIVTEAVDGVEAMEVFFGRFIPQFWYSLIIPLMLFLVTFRIYPLFSFILLAVVPIIPLSMMLISKWAARSMSGFWNDYQGLSSLFLENLQGVVTLKLFNRSEKRMEEMEAQAWGFRNSTMELLRMQLTSISVMDTLVYGFAGLGIFIAVRGFYTGILSLDSFFVLLMLSVEFFLPIRKLGSLFHAGVNGMQAGKKIVGFLESEESICPPKKGKIPKGFDIIFDNVSFSYSANLPPIFNSVSVRFEAGGIYGIEGESGCGKSTFGRMMMRFHDPQSGQILFGGVPLTEIPFETLRSKIGFVDTMSTIFDGTIAENLLLADSSAVTRQMLDACLAAGLGGLVKDSADLQKPVGEGGSMISGGERQRLAVARVILQDPDVFIFDEAAGSVDAESEELIRKTLFELAGEKTVFIISHRQSMLTGLSEVYKISGASMNRMEAVNV